MQLAIASKEVVMFMVGAATVATALPKDSGKQEERGNKSVKGLASSVCEVATAVLTQPSVALGIVEMNRSGANHIPEVQITARDKAGSLFSKAQSDAQSTETSRNVEYRQCPPREELQNCLETCPITDSRILKEKGLLDTTAKVFANKSVTPLRIHQGVSQVVSYSIHSGALTDMASAIATAIVLEAGVEICCSRKA